MIKGESAMLNSMAQYEAAIDATDAKIAELRRKGQTMRDHYAELKRNACLKSENVKNNSELLELNVGGASLFVKREILTQFPGSGLAELFSGRWDEKLLRDAKGCIFLDIDPDAFKRIVIFLQQSKSDETKTSNDISHFVSDEKTYLFTSLLDFLGLKKEYANAVKQDDHVDASPANEVSSKEKSEEEEQWDIHIRNDISKFIGTEMECLKLAGKLFAFIDFFISAKTKDIVSFAAWGQTFSTTKKTLNIYDDIELVKRFGEAVNKHNQGNKENVYVVDYLPHIFGMAVNAFRLKATSMKNENINFLDTSLDFHERKHVRSIMSLISEDEDCMSCFKMTDSLIVSSDQYDQLLEWLGPDKDVRLLYRASRDGWDGKSFHRLCDGRGSTLTIIKSTGGYIFGGYLGASWNSTSTGSYIPCKDAFLYTLNNHAGLPPVKLGIKAESKYAACGRADWGPVFGGGHDICVLNNANVKNSSYTNVGDSYHCPSGITFTSTGKTFLTGTCNYQSSEVEVFEIKHAQ